MKNVETKKERKLNHLGKLIFLLNAFIAFLIITGSFILVRTEFGKTALLFGFVLLAVSTTLKFMHEW